MKYHLIISRKDVDYNSFKEMIERINKEISSMNLGKKFLRSYSFYYAHIEQICVFNELNCNEEDITYLSLKHNIEFSNRPINEILLKYNAKFYSLCCSL